MLRFHFSCLNSVFPPHPDIWVAAFAPDIHHITRKIQGHDHPFVGGIPKHVIPLLVEGSDDSHTPAGGFYFLSNGIHTAEQAFCHGSAQDGHVAALVHLHVGEIASCTVLPFSDLVEFKGGSDDIDPFNRIRSEEHTSELQSLMSISYAVFCLKKNK